MKTKYAKQTKVIRGSITWVDRKRRRWRARVHQRAHRGFARVGSGPDWFCSPDPSQEETVDELPDFWIVMSRRWCRTGHNDSDGIVTGTINKCYWKPETKIFPKNYVFVSEILDKDTNKCVESKVKQQMVWCQYKTQHKHISRLKSHFCGMLDQYCEKCMRSILWEIQALCTLAVSAPFPESINGFHLSAISFSFLYCHKNISSPKDVIVIATKKLWWIFFNTDSLK